MCVCVGGGGGGGKRQFEKLKFLNLNWNFQRVGAKTKNLLGEGMDIFWNNMIKPTNILHTVYIWTKQGWSILNISFLQSK